jgi:hypothetical protein
VFLFMAYAVARHQVGFGGSLSGYDLTATGAAKQRERLRTLQIEPFSVVSRAL